MLATDSVMGAPEGLLSVFLITGFLLGTCLNEETCVGDACSKEGILQLKIDRARTDTVSGLKYKERSKDLVAMVDVIRVCLPGVNPNVLADSFSSCKNEKMEGVCTVAKRGWLENKDGKSVVKENALLATFGEMKGGEDAVRECLQIPEVYYYEYDYADYYEEYDYLEESGRRQRRAAATKEDKEAKKANRKARQEKRKKRKQNRRNRKGGSVKMRRGGKRNKNECKNGKCKKNQTQKEKRERKAEKKAEKEKKVEKAKKAEQRAAKKAAKLEEKEASKSDKDDQKKALTKLGLQKMPSKSSLNKLTCVQNKMKELLVNCAKDILSKTN